MTHLDFINTMYKFGFSIGRKLAPTKEKYIEAFPTHEVFFNACIKVVDGNSVFWWEGDIDISREFAMLKEVAKYIKHDLILCDELEKDILPITVEET